MADETDAPAIDAIHPLAPDHLPYFIPGADGSDPVMTNVAVFLIAGVLGIGVLYFTLHALPERMAHRSNSVQLQLVGILALVALFTHQTIFWVAALALAAVKLPDVTGPLNDMANALSRVSGVERISGTEVETVEAAKGAHGEAGSARLAAGPEAPRDA